MKLVQGGRNIILLVVVLVVAIGFVWAAINGGAETWFNPTPEKIAEEFIGSLAAHRYTGARNNLSSELRDETTTERLRVLIASIEAKKSGIDQALGEKSMQFGDTAWATVRVIMKDGSETTVELPLIREKGLWRITGLEEMWSLILTHLPFKLFSI